MPDGMGKASGEERRLLLAASDTGRGCARVESSHRGRGLVQPGDDVVWQSLGEFMFNAASGRLLLLCHGQPVEWIDRILVIPKVVVFTGHMIDRPDRPQPRFPTRLEVAVQQAIQQQLKAISGKIGFASAACGSDILFLESVQALQGETHVVLPYNAELYVNDSVDLVPGENWRQRFEAVIAQTAHVVTASTQRMTAGGISYDYADTVLFGLAALRAREMETDLVGLAVWDGLPGDGPGGTASIVRRWKKLGLPVHIVHLDNGDVSTSLESIEPEAGIGDDPKHVDDTDVSVKAILFADAVGYSKLTEEQVPQFVEHFLGAIRELMVQMGKESIIRNTWGDGLYMVFDTIRDAGVFALALRDLITATNWQAKGLPANLNLRIALHAGPVYSCIDPVTGLPNCVGTHVSPPPASNRSPPPATSTPAKHSRRWHPPRRSPISLASS